MPRLLTCAQAAAFEPRSFVLACGDGSADLTGLSWQAWTMSLAIGTGQWEQNDCQPDCARGRFHAYRVVRLVFDHPQITKLGVFFNRLRATFSGPTPMGSRVETVEPLLPVLPG